MTDEDVPRWTWLPWRRKYRPELTPDGGTLRMVPPESPRADWGPWAAERWQAWDAGMIQDLRTARRAACPPCLEHGNLGTAEAFVRTHPDRASRKRWANHAAVARAKIAALGACRCGADLTGPSDRTLRGINETVARLHSR